MWYIWKAQNDNHFQRQTWTPMQVHNAVAAHINTHTQAMLLPATTAANHTTDTPQSLHQPPHSQQGMLNSTAGMAALSESSTEPTNTLPVPSHLPTQQSSTLLGMTLSLPQEPMMNSYEIAAPALLQGSRCYVDASIEPDQPNLQPRSAGLGVFILNFQEQPAQAMYIKAMLFCDHG
jgi:hypothetical protein